MHEITTVGWIANLLAYSAIIPIALFIYFYGTKPVKGRKYLRRFSNLWQTTRIGQTLMYHMMAWLGYLVFIASSLIFRDWVWGRDEVRFIVYAALVILFWEFFFALRRLQKSKIPKKENDFGVVTDDDEPYTQEVILPDAAHEDSEDDTAAADQGKTTKS